MTGMTTVRAPIDLTVNGHAHRADEVPGDRRLIDVLRDDLGLTGTKEGCDDGTCGACVVLVDGKVARACRTSAREAAGCEVTTIEGLGSPKAPHLLQRAFVAADAVQCGFCTPGMIMAAAALLDRDPHPTRDGIRRWLGSNLCRCTGYQGIVDAVEAAAEGRVDAPRAWPPTAVAAGAGTGAVAGDAAGSGAAGGTAGAAAPRGDAMDKATGRALYAADLTAGGMLHAVAVRSPHAHADVLGVDVARARSVPGVVAVLTAADVPGENRFGRKVKDEQVLYADRVRRVGDPVALVVAVTREAAAAALDAVEVTYRALPAVFGPEAALADGAPEIHPGGNVCADNAVRAGDAAAELGRSDLVVEATYRTAWNEHAYLEPEAALAAWDGDVLVVRTATQYPHYQRTEIARTLGLPNDRVRVATAAVGGGFGGKTELSCQALAALATWKTGRPVRIVYSREESFLTTTKRHPFRIRVEAGATRDGDLTGLRMDFVADTGAYASFGPGIVVKSFGSAAGPYRWRGVDLHGRTVYTNNPTGGAMRGPGTTQVAFALEATLDRLAERLGIDPLALRERNRLREGDRLLSGQILDRDTRFDATIAAVRSYWEEALARCAEANAAAEGSGVTVRRGVGVASVWYGIGGGGGGPVPGMDPTATVGRGPGRASAELADDGTVVVRTGAVDLGQGSATVMARIAGEELGVPPDRIRVVTGDSAAPDAGPTVGSRVTVFVGNAVREAAADLGEAILGTAGAMLARPAAELAIDGDRVVVAGGGEGGGEGVSLAEIARARTAAGRAVVFDGFFDADLPAFDPKSGLGEPYLLYVTGTQMAEVEVDARTGTVRVLRVVAAHDVGRPAFPEGLVGQLEGGIAMGIGFALTEDFVPGETRGFKEYRIPRTRDVPEMTTILVDDPDAPPDQRAKGVAECSNMVVAPAIANAVAMATGERVDRLPIRLARPR